MTAVLSLVIPLPVLYYVQLSLVHVFIYHEVTFHRLCNNVWLRILSWVASGVNRPQHELLGEGSRVVGFFELDFTPLTEGNTSGSLLGDLGVNYLIITGEKGRGRVFSRGLSPDKVTALLWALRTSPRYLSKSTKRDQSQQPVSHRHLNVRSTE